MADRDHIAPGVPRGQALECGIARAEVLSLKTAEFVESARALGASNGRIVLKEILPNALPPVLALMALLMSYGILSEASLSFLGVGDPNVISLGGMLSNGLQYATTAWWVPTFPGAAIFLLVLLLNIIGDSLSVVLNPALAMASRERRPR
jgi:peptide/nickel transport system permease protein